MRSGGRFVAGAVCPQCAATDRLKIDPPSGDWRWCVACGFEEQLADLPAQDDAQDEAVVRLIDTVTPALAR